MNLNQDLEILDELNKLRDEAKSLRERGLRSLKEIRADTRSASENHKTRKEVSNKTRSSRIGLELKHDSSLKSSYPITRWIRSGNDVEIALLVKVQNHRDLSEDDAKNNNAEAERHLTSWLELIEIEDLFQQSPKKSRGEESDLPPVPILVAARAMRALVGRARTTFSKATMTCYYRIVRELNVAERNGWIIGAAKAGVGGYKSAFVTAECVRAILALKKSFEQTLKFLKRTRDLYEEYVRLNRMIDFLGDAGKEHEHPLRRWTESAINRMWLDCYILTNPRDRQIALFCPNHYDDKKNQLLLSDFCSRKDGEWTPHFDKKGVNMKTVKEYLDKIIPSLVIAFNDAEGNIKKAINEIKVFRDAENKQAKTDTNGLKQRELMQRYERHESGHLMANSAMEDAYRSTKEILDILKSPASVSDLDESNIEKLDRLIDRLGKIPGRIHRLLEPTRQYLSTVLDRELAASSSGSFDAGELVFAAASFGWLTDWNHNENLTRACKLLVNSLPESGRLSTSHAFHATPEGYKLLPIGCEMTSSLAQLLHKTDFQFDPTLVTKMLNIFEEKLIDLSPGNKEGSFAGWNFEGSPTPDKPCVWVTAVSVLALDRIVRMLSQRINEIVYRHFEVIRAEKPHTDKTLNDLLYPDSALCHYYFQNHGKEYKNQHSISIYLELMRAHVMRASLPEKYKDEKVFASIFYGPPGTGKTTLAESVALSSKVPIIMLSPSDLMVQGQQLIEGRARDVFKALSMLTQTVIVLDEFEQVFKRRDSGNKIEGFDSYESQPTDSLEKILHSSLKEIPKAIRGDDITFKFILNGMLPKLLKLNDAAKKQSFVYCLATNYLEEMGDAAKRPGRFDHQIPVYHACALSRAGAFLYRFSQLTDKNLSLRLVGDQAKRFINAVIATKGEPSSDLARRFFKITKDEMTGEVKSGYEFFEYVLLKTDDVKNIDLQVEDINKEAETNFKPKEVDSDSNKKFDREQMEKFFLTCFERNCVRTYSTHKNVTDNFAKHLRDCLAPSKSK